MVAHANGVGIRETKADFTFQFVMVFDDNISFATDILCRCLNVRPNERFEFLSKRLIDHLKFSRWFVKMLVHDGLLGNPLFVVTVCLKESHGCKGTRRIS